VADSDAAFSKEKPYVWTEFIKQDAQEYKSGKMPLTSINTSSVTPWLKLQPASRG